MKGIGENSLADWQSVSQEDEQPTNLRPPGKTPPLPSPESSNHKRHADNFFTSGAK